ncbi:MAG: hypothetical protein JO035_11445 [Betaproteobacteria bacterium]|nr:hypothetical protein [Betaproteobacteria bacterium]
MSRIVAGRFENPLAADAALADLQRAGFRNGEYESFYVTPPGQHGAHPIGGDSHSDAGARTAGLGAVAGAVLGALAGAIVAAVATGGEQIIPVLLAAGLCAYVGSFMGTVLKLRRAHATEHTPEHPVEIPAGRMIAVNVDRPEMEPRAVDVLRRHGAIDLGRAEGTWRDGSWRDFDPRHPLHA